MNICFIGNPNCGKTTLFNNLTGSYQKVGNWSGVTTEAKTGKYKENNGISLTDLPGIYSLQANSLDELAVTEYFKNSSPDVIINVVDGTNLERSLFLTCELVSLKIPVVIAVNYADVLEKNKITLSEKALSETFGNIPVVKISAVKGKNIDKLMKEVKNAALPKIEKPLLSASDVYGYIESKIDIITKRKTTVAEKFTLKADSLLTSGVIGVPIFIATMIIVYFTSIKTGLFFGGFIEDFFISVGNKTGGTLSLIGAPQWFCELVKEGVFGGLGTALSFLPQIVILFFLITLLEESGYMARVAFLFDGLFYKSGLSGKSVISFAVSCGCGVGGITAARTIENETERKATIFLAPFMPCGAKIAVFGWIASVFFNGNPFVAVSLYFLSVLSVVVGGRIIFVFNKRHKKPKEESSDQCFVLEMPVLRIPSIKNVVAALKEKAVDFIVKAGSVIFFVSVVLWFLKSFGLKGYDPENFENTFLYYIGNFIKYPFYPLGFGNAKASVALLSGLFAKEGVIEALTVVCGNKESLFGSFNGIFSVYAFAAFVLLSPPCLAALSVAKRELNNKKDFISMIVFQTFFAYAVAFAINFTGTIINGSLNLIFICAFVIIISILIIVGAIAVFGGCDYCLKKGSCKKCPKGKRNTII